MRLGIDIGGTFTDFALIDDETGELHVEKTLTTPGNPDEAVFQGIDHLSGRLTGFLERTQEVIHATTLISNTLIAGNWVRTGLLTTEGFRDVLEMRREVRYDIYDLFIRFPEPIVPRFLRIGIPERMLRDGSMYLPLDEKAVRRAAKFFGEQGVKAVAVCFLHAFQNSAHERSAGEILADILPGAAISLSHEVHPVAKEYERTSTTVVDACIKPLVSAYLDRVAEGLNGRGYKRRLFIMLSNGGSATLEAAKKFPVNMVESGPAAGVEASAYYGRLINLVDQLSFDMGGTTAKLCIVEQGRAARTQSFEVNRVHRFKAGSGIPIAVPVYDLLEIGAGGGSIARVDDLGLLQVGPESAGSNPGPACYGQGGKLPTVTDSDLYLGFLNPAYFLGGEMALQPESAARAIEEHVARPLGLGPEQAAAGIFQMVTETMAAAARVYITDKAKAAPSLALVAFGGAGPVHAVALARVLGCPEVIIPPYSGVMSSLGLLVAPLAFERSRSVQRLLEQIDLAWLEERFLELEAETLSLMPEGSEPEYRRTLDLCHPGQDHALEVEVRAPFSRPESPAQWKQAFEDNYRSLYGRVDGENPIQVQAQRVHLSQRLKPLRIQAPDATAPAVPKAHRPVYAFDQGRFADTPVYNRASLQVGQSIPGPAIVEERESTTVLASGDMLEVDPIGCLRIQVGGSVLFSLQDGRESTVL